MARKKASQGSCSRKRTCEESPSSSNEPKKRRLIHEKKDNYEEELSKKDKYCWTCHSKEPTDDDMWYFWPCCPRIYHFNCMSDYPTSESETTCPECQLESVDGTRLSKPVPRIKLNELLLSVIQKYLDDKGKKSNDKRKNEKKFKLLPIFVQWPPLADTDLIKVVDFTYLINKIRNDTYSKASEFFSDVKWILHNCLLLYGAESNVTKDAGKLVQLIKADLLDIEACHECCYLVSQNPGSFIKLCNPPHQIIWAQIYKYPYWPAKCLKVSQETICAKFFGEPHQIGKLSVSKCYYISRNHPNFPKPVPKTKSYNDSIAELDEYIKLYELQRRESFKYYPDKTAFKPENAGKENQEIHLNVMGTQENSSSVKSSDNLASDDLRLGADFSNLNHPASELSEDKMPSTDRLVIAGDTHSTSSSLYVNGPGSSCFSEDNSSVGPQIEEIPSSGESSFDRPVIAGNTHSTSSSLYVNGLEPSSFNQYNSSVDPQIEEIPSSGESVEARSNNLLPKRPLTLSEQISAVRRFFQSSTHLGPQGLNLIISSTKDLIQYLSNHSINQRTTQLTRLNEEFKKQLLKQRSEFEEEKKQLAVKIRKECAIQTLEFEDKAKNAYMLLRSIRIGTCEDMKEKESEYENRLLEKDNLLEQCQEKLRKLEAENIELKKELENIEQNKELEKDSINKAKRNLYCYVCLKSANILCCIYAAYCSKLCQTEDEERHKVTCVKETALVSKTEYQTQTIKVTEVILNSKVNTQMPQSSASVSKL